MNKNEIEELLESVKKQEKNRDIHIPYSETSGRQPDFEVSYEFDIDPELKDIKTRQGMRSDFLYKSKKFSGEGIYMIWPEFLDKNGDVILSKKTKILNSGNATMWIGDNDIRDNIHRKRIKVGTEGFWVIGSKKIAKVKVTKIIGLVGTEHY